MIGLRPCGELVDLPGGRLAVIEVCRHPEVELGLRTEDERLE